MKTHAHPHRRAKLPELTDRLRRKSRKITGPRQAILELLRRHAHPMSSKEIFAALPQGHCDLATVYRSMHLLESMKMVKRYDLGDGVARFELLAEGDDGHHHHLVCVRCAAVVEIEECFTRDLEERIALRNGFKAITHRLEFFGVCPECQ
ncbi:MAG TPA: Fur family transcriptional regulator [Verrucomicrobiae bacterium]|nr:Fur family transcriptional regulator [Verrucomicrobiae bacterium]